MGPGYARRANGAMLASMRRVLLLALLVGCSGPAAPSDAGPDAGAALDAGTDAGTDAGPPLPPPPATLSAAGLYAEGIDGALAEGVRPYDVRHPLWTDGLGKARYLLLPPGTSIDVSDPDHWSFPEGTRVFKVFLLEGRTLETRLLWKAGPSPTDWVYVAYRHRDDGSDADPVPDGEVDVLGTFHDVPAQADCRNCHRGAGDFVIGLGAHQIDRATFDAWIADGVLPAGAPYAEPPGTDVERAALGYLHGNCGHCHNDVHPLSAHRAMRLRLPVGLTDASTAPAWITTAGVMAGHVIDGAGTIVVPGDPSASQLYVRMMHRDDLAMPPVGTETIDAAALDTIAAWITAGR